MIFNGQQVNKIVKATQVSKQLLYYIHTQTDCYVDTAKFDDDNLNQIIGLQVYRDYYKCLAVVYTNQYGTHWVGIGQFNGDDIVLQYTRYAGDYDKLQEELKTLLNNNTKVVEDFEREELMDAIASGDSEWVNSIVGDRDLAELI